MRILPLRTAPANAAVDRRHAPKPGAYGTYRACLRWEFGFSCAFCLIHEADLIEHGVEGTGLTSIEHHIPQSDDPGGAHVDEYANCFYACRFCNRSRGTEPTVDPRGKRLLHPCRDAWGDHFTLADDRLQPRQGDEDAERTHAVYDLDDPRKRQLRRDREESIRDALRALREGPQRFARLGRAAESPGPSRILFLDAALDLRDLMKNAWRTPERFSAIPEDADTGCRCPTTRGCVLPAFLDLQLLPSPA